MLQGLVMRHLILMRHAKTEAWNDGIDDAGRQLTDQGKREAICVAQALCEVDLRPDRVLVSTARRSRQTWQEMQPTLGDAEVLVRDALYLADDDEIAEVTELDHHPEGVTLLIGHNPGLHTFVVDLAMHMPPQDVDTARMLSGRFPTASTAVFSASSGSGLADLRLTRMIWGRDLAEAEQS